MGLKEQITTINNFEPRVNNLNITVTVDADSNDMYATIEYDIIGLPVPTQRVEVLSFPTRYNDLFGQYVNLDFDQIKESIRLFEVEHDFY